MKEILFEKENLRLQVQEETTLLEAMRLAGLKPDAPCGGKGTCKKCEVEIKRGTAWEKVLACQTSARAALENQEEPLLVRTLHHDQGHHILLEGTGRQIRLAPSLRRVTVTVPPCRKGESDSDWKRLALALGMEEDGQPPLPVLSRLSPILRAGEGRISAVISGNRILEIQSAGDKANRPLLMAAVDIGTTTVASYLMDGETGQILATASALNPQTAFGADVIARANYALQEGTGELAKCIRSQLSAMLETMCEKAGQNPRDIYQVSVVGNTCMHHLFLGVSPDSLVFAPYNPVTHQTMDLPASHLVKNTNPAARLFVLPVIAGFVGADTVGCMLAIDLEEEEKISLMIDIGTNGEVVLGNKDRRITCSTAAGPAFEGAKITCGMRGAVGAIDHIQVKDGQPAFRVIGGGKPIGLCGSGLIDLVAALLDDHLIDDTGRLMESPRTFSYEGHAAWLIADAKETADGKPIFLTQKDIREVQLAKGAMAAGMQLLAKKLGIRISEIQQVFIAGAFGNYMDPASACRIGLIPAELSDRILPIGNAAGEGARRALLDHEEYDKACRLARSTEFLELASLPEFQDQFVDEMAFETDEE